MENTDTFDIALRFVLAAEGGYSDDVSDAGGPTKAGVTQHTYTAWLAEHSMPNADVSQISAQEVRQIYKDEYWDQAKLDEFVAAGCSPKVAVLIFDTGVNVGMGRAVKLLQATVGVATDGVMGHDTINAVLHSQQTLGEYFLVTQYLARRRNYYNALAAQNKTDQKFLKGWLARVDHLADYVAEEFPMNNGADHA